MFLSQNASPKYETSKRCAIIAGTTILVVSIVLVAILIGVYMFIDGEKAMIEVNTGHIILLYYIIYNLSTPGLKLSLKWRGYGDGTRVYIYSSLSQTGFLTLPW